MPTISDVAKACGCSTATVSYVINNGPRQVRPRTRQRILETIRQLNYTPSAIARSLTGKAVNTIGVVILNPVQCPLASPYYRPILSGILDEVTLHHKSLNLFNGNIWDSKQCSVPLFCDGRCDGLLIFLPTLFNDIVDSLKEQPIPYVIIGEGGCDPFVSSIDIDNIAAAREVTRAMIAQGHRRIAHFAGDGGLQSSFDRIQGYRDALEENGIAFDASLVIPGEYSPGSGSDRAQQMFSGQSRLPTAIFAANDAIAYGAIRALHDLGLNVPEDVSVAGIDGAEPEKNFYLPNHVQLTTADQHLEMLGSSAAKMLMEALKLKEGVVTKIVQPFDLRIGDTVHAPGSHAFNAP